MSLLESWSLGSHIADGVTHPTYRKGSGPGVIVIHEVPGITPKVIAFAEEVVARGFTVVLPSLFGRPEAESTIAESVRTIARICVSREFSMFALAADEPGDELATLAGPRAACRARWTRRRCSRHVPHGWLRTRDAR